MNSRAQQIEALLFVAGEAVSKKELQKLLSISESELSELLDELTIALHDHGITIIVTETHAQLVTSPDVAEFLASFQQTNEEELSRAASETLAIVAYRGPISRYDVDALRGVDSRRMIRQLMRRGVLQQVKRSGRTPLYDVSEEFLQRIGITKKSDLPDFERLSQDDNIKRILNEQG